MEFPLIGSLRVIWRREQELQERTVVLPIVLMASAVFGDATSCYLTDAS
jgi:hypothetical protein